MAIENIRDYRRNVLSFLTSVVLGGLAISILSALLVTSINGATLTGGDWVLLLVASVMLTVAAIAYTQSPKLQLTESRTWDTSIKPLT